MEDNKTMPEELEANLVRNFDLSSFVKSKDKMIATNDNAYRGNFELSHERLLRNREYTTEEIERIITSGTLSE
jgi:hypothetical protein